MTSESLPIDFAQNRFGLRFMTPTTEAHFQHWRNEQNLPVIRFAALLSISAWLVAPLVGDYLLPELEWHTIFWPAYVFLIPIFTFCLVASSSQFRKWATPLATFMIAATGCIGVWVLVERLYVKGNGSDGLGMPLSAVINIASFAIFMRLPPRSVLLSVGVYFLGFLWLLMGRHREGTVAYLDYLGYLIQLVNVYTIAAVISIVTDRFLRRSYIAEMRVAISNAALERSRNLMRRYVSPALADQIIEGRSEGIEAPQRRRVTVLFSDIVGFTDIADRVEPEVLTQVISEYMGAMAEIVEQHQGSVNEFIGDGLMALFGAPQPLDPEQQALNAVRAAQAMQARLPDLNARWRKLGLGAELQMRIGVNTGMGSVGSYGSEGRMNYTAIGLQINIAARIQSHCEPGGVLISDSTWQLVREAIECAPRGEVQCKGVHFPVAVYSPEARA